MLHIIVITYSHPESHSYSSCDPCGDFFGDSHSDSPFDSNGDSHGDTYCDSHFDSNSDFFPLWRFPCWCVYVHICLYSTYAGMFVHVRNLIGSGKSSSGNRIWVPYLKYTNTYIFTHMKAIPHIFLHLQGIQMYVRKNIFVYIYVHIQYMHIYVYLYIFNSKMHQE
jgi:hypothetical protein